MGNGRAHSVRQGTFGPNFVGRVLIITGIGCLELTAGQVIYPRKANREPEMTL
jgi:hypothetical protein